MATQVKKTKVQFVVSTNNNYASLFVTGNVKELGEWNLVKGLELKYDETLNAYVGTKMLELDTNVEYKVSASKSWDNVELGTYNEEVSNHTFTASKGHKEIISILNFKN